MLIFARSMRTEVAASRQSFLGEQADAVELQRSAIYSGGMVDAVTVLQTQAKQIPIGKLASEDIADVSRQRLHVCLRHHRRIVQSERRFRQCHDDRRLSGEAPGMPQDVADSIVLWAGRGDPAGHAPCELLSSRCLGPIRSRPLM